MIKLIEIDENNYLECLKLSVKEEQKMFVATNIASLAQAYIYIDIAKPFVIYNDDIQVGFMMFEVDKEKEEYSVWRFMIDQKYQGNGYGTDALKLGINYLINEGAKVIKLSHVEGNEKTSKLYLNVGFKYNGELDGDELVMEYIV